ncbi:MAG: 16S rRNA (adenine(1518)-N(6)/adenine(1519)-N(6))-dimethyltransferase RsmA [Deltaproteobacteria bacterium]|nr:16S rRNA (adenine(1518)-N(6)/adenine(1519)-N(6))-dimethyltransferase RsmA [Deltaproteobacteria bacterium]
MTTVRSILRDSGMRPRKCLGQSFLEDKNVISKIILVADIHAQDIVVEIGAGLGIMTEILASQAGKVIAIDVDPRMTAILRERLQDQPRVEIMERDVLTFDFSTLQNDDKASKLKVIGNIPYNISTPILFHLLAFRRHISSMVLMFQKEVVDRIVASPGTKEYGIPSVLISMFTVPTREMNVPASCFYPQPKVASSVIKIVTREKPLFDLADELFFSKIVKIAFAMRRKTILNNLRAADLPFSSDEEIEILLDQAGIEGRRRGETLSPEEFGRLSNVFFAALT